MLRCLLVACAWAKSRFWRRQRVDCYIRNGWLTDNQYYINVDEVKNIVFTCPDMTHSKRNTYYVAFHTLGRIISQP